MGHALINLWLMIEYLGRYIIIPLPYFWPIFTKPLVLFHWILMLHFSVIEKLTFKISMCLLHLSLFKMSFFYWQKSVNNFAKNLYFWIRVLQWLLKREKKEEVFSSSKREVFEFSRSPGHAFTSSATYCTNAELFYDAISMQSETLLLTPFFRH